MPEQPANHAYLRAACAILEALSGALPEGLSNADLARITQCSRPQVTRLCAALAQYGWVEKLPSERFRITARFARLALRVMASFEQAQARLADLQRNYTLPTL
ncbi:helix-turn-helix domain-containing protein [Vandammella animalimorsus]